jgi:hypothetical protein
MKHRYIRVAERAVQAGKAALKAGTHEKASFLAYHAFESSGGALGTHVGLDMGKTVSHAVKLSRFLQAARTAGFPRLVADLSIRLSSMRNRFLYPEEQPDGTIKAPEDQITPAKGSSATQ